MAEAQDPGVNGGGGEHAPGERESRREVATSEWVVAALSALLVLALIGYTLREGLTRSEGPPEISIRTDTIVRSPSGHLVHFILENDGGQTAATVQVSGSLLRDGETLEESAATVDYVPVQAERDGYLQFQHDPSSHELRLRVIGFSMP